jgi:hypothetical protein
MLAAAHAALRRLDLQPVAAVQTLSAPQATKATRSPSATNFTTGPPANRPLTAAGKR